jgi:hypothetical protein
VVTGGAAGAIGSLSLLLQKVPRPDSKEFCADRSLSRVKNILTKDFVTGF